ncbi:MAG: hypothetical protein WAO20_15470 [Acidobacteriota bacterium]|jgi:antitoxin (DNA-binding transcriptional repressor) of toxin-antitoxin stability system
MERATISQVKNRLSAYLRKVRQGESVLILDRHRAVARLERVDNETAPNDSLDRLERNGLIKRSRTPLPLELLRTAPPEAGKSVVEALLEERGEGR